MTFNYTVTDAADAGVRKQISAPLVQFNESRAGPVNFRPLAVILTDDADTVAGGLWGSTAYGWLHVDLLVVPEAARVHSPIRCSTMSRRCAARRCSNR